MLATAIGIARIKKKGVATIGEAPRQSHIFIGETHKFGPRFAFIRHCFDEFRFSSAAVAEKSAEMSIW
jgi:hypothetical protein